MRGTKLVGIWSEKDPYDNYTTFRTNLNPKRIGIDPRPNVVTIMALAVSKEDSGS